jgi:hypothetical protein
MVTVHFPEDVVRYAEQHNWRLKGINGSISMQGNKVRARQRRSVEQAARAEDADRSEKRRRLAQQQPEGAPGSANPAQTDQDARGGVASSDAGPRAPLGDWAADPDNPTPSTSRAAAKAAAAADAATAAAAKAAATAHLPPKLDMNNTYPFALVAILDMLPERGQPGAPPSFVSRPNRHSPTAFALLTKAQKSRWHRKLKKFAAQLCSFPVQEGLRLALDAAQAEVTALAIATNAANVAAGHPPPAPVHAAGSAEAGTTADTADECEMETGDVGTTNHPFTEEQEQALLQHEKVESDED